jgi:hypothetical protein
MKHAMAFFMIFYLPISAWAALGNNDGSVQKDKKYFNGAVTLDNFSTHRVYRIVTTNGCVVREFVSPSGTVFGVAWQGPYIPDLRQLLGSHYHTYIDALKAERMKYRGRRPLNINKNGLIVQMSGHMRAYRGRAYLTALLPQGIDITTIR